MVVMTRNAGVFFDLHYDIWLLKATAVYVRHVSEILLFKTARSKMEMKGKLTIQNGFVQCKKLIT